MELEPTLLEISLEELLKPEYDSNIDNYRYSKIRDPAVIHKTIWTTLQLDPSQAQKPISRNAKCAHLHRQRKVRYIEALEAELRKAIAEIEADTNVFGFLD